MRAVAFAAVLLCHPPADMLGDALGDRMVVVQNGLRRRLGLAEKIPKPDRGDPVEKYGLLPTLVDDLVEDAFKAGCVGAHVYMGSLLRAALIHPETLPVLPRVEDDVLARRMQALLEAQRRQRQQ